MLAFVMRNRLALINLGLWVLFLWLIHFAINWALPFVLPLLFGILVAILLEPFVKLFGKIRVPRWIGALLTLLIFFGGGAALLLLLAARMTIELADFIKRVPEAAGSLVQKGQELVHEAVNYYGSLSPAMSEKVREHLDQFGNTIADITTGIATSLLNFITQVPTMATILLLSLLIAYFISKDFPLWKKRLLRIIHPTVQAKSNIVIDDLGNATIGYIRAQAILISITFVQVLAGLLILKVDYAFTLSLIAALLDILPLLGTGSLFIPWAVYAFVTGDTSLGIGLLVVYGLIVAVRQILEAKVMASSIGLDPLVTIVVMYAAYQAIGFLGVILAPFLIIIFMSLLKVEAFHFLLDPDTTDDIPPKIFWRKEDQDHV